MSHFQYIAAGSEDTIIKVVPVDKSDEFFELTGHDGPILKIDTSPKGLLASSSGDGTIRIWDLKERKEVKVIKGFETATSFYNAKSFGKFSLCEAIVRAMTPGLYFQLPRHLNR